MKRLLVGALIIVFCGVLVPTFVVADEEGEADTMKGELQQNIEQQKGQGEQKLDEMKKEQEKVKEKGEQEREGKKKEQEKVKDK